MSIVTKGGDLGLTSLLGGKRVPKHHQRVECYGTIDELNAIVGFAISFSEDGSFEKELIGVQNDLHLLSSRVALDPDAPEEIKASVPVFGEDRLKKIEEIISQIEPTLPQLTRFINYGGTRFASSLHLLRAVSRRAERALVRLSASEEVEPVLIAYMNRLSDLFFIMARAANIQAGVPERFWEK